MPAELETGWLELVHGRKRSWWTGPARVSLQVLGGLYGAVIGTYRLQYDWGWRRPEAAPCRICSVGNLTVGGSGKTTTVRWIVRRLQEWGVRPAILSHGYRASGGSDPRPRVVADPTGIRLPITESGDEPQLLARRLPSVPVLIGRRRNESARVAAEQYGVQVCVLDDGYQYWKVQKNLDLLLLDATSPWGPGGVFPGGTLR
ncbi:MAG: tetraacyldisaccharide 4'-kinase, partial [Armatimonadetes bacterium]|nr:tetraacyldisaccharide 4'-kinase [Armatimonadota bacterium]